MKWSHLTCSAASRLCHTALTMVIMGREKPLVAIVDVARAEWLEQRAVNQQGSWHRSIRWSQSAQSFGPPDHRTSHLEVILRAHRHHLRPQQMRVGFCMRDSLCFFFHSACFSALETTLLDKATARSPVDAESLIHHVRVDNSTRGTSLLPLTRSKDIYKLYLSGQCHWEAYPLVLY